METDYSWCYLKKSWLFRFSAPFLNGNFFPCPLGHKLFSSWKHSCLTETLHKKINNKKTQRNQGSCDKTAWCFSFIQLGTSFGLHLLSAKRPGENSRHMEGGSGGWREARKRESKGNFTKEKGLQLGLVQGKIKVSRGALTQSSAPLSLPPLLSVLCPVLITFRSHSLPSCSVFYPLKHLK